MRFRIPPLLPPYAVLVLVITYAIGALWLGSATSRRDHATDRSGRTGMPKRPTTSTPWSRPSTTWKPRAAALCITGDESFVEQFERGRRRAPALLSSLRDKMRDDTTELSLIEELVSLISERTTIIVAGIERRRSAPDQPPDTAVPPSRQGDRRRHSHHRRDARGARAGRAAADPRDADAHARRRAQGPVRHGGRDAAAGDIALPRGEAASGVHLRHPGRRRPRRDRNRAGRGCGARDAGVGTLLRDALLRVRLAAASEAADSGVGEHLRSLVATMEQAVAAHTGAYERDSTQRRAENASSRR